MLLDMECLSQVGVLVGVLVGALACLLLLLNHRQRYATPSISAAAASASTHTAQATPVTPVFAPSSPLSCPAPLSVNYHFTRRCNYACGFCFHTAKTSSHLPLERARHGLTLLRARGMQKINFSGGEPLIVDDGKYLGQLCEHACSLGVFVSIVSNGSLMTEAWLQQYAPFIDIIAISCDSFDDQTNKSIGRKDTSTPGELHTTGVWNVAEWCRKYVQFKINTVVNRKNHLEDMSAQILELRPVRWKIFQCLPVVGENMRGVEERALRNVKNFLVTDDEYRAFLTRHSRVSSSVRIAEPNSVMQSSYFLLDEEMRFLDCSQGDKRPSVSIFDDMDRALCESGFAPAEYHQRNGDFYRLMPSKATALVHTHRQAKITVALEDDTATITGAAETPTPAQSMTSSMCQMEEHQW